MSRRVILFAGQALTCVLLAALLLTLWQSPQAAPIAIVLFIAGLAGSVVALAGAVDRREASHKA